MSKSTVHLIIRFLLILGAVLFLLQCQKIKPKRQYSVTSCKVTRGNIVSTVSGNAKLVPQDEMKISSAVSGQITRLGVQEGDRVQKGDFLLQLNQEEYKAALEQALSNLQFAKAGLDKDFKDYKRIKELYANNLISDLELETARATLKQAKANVEQAIASSKQAKERFLNTTIYSPTDGVVIRIDKKVGEMAMGSQFTLDVIMVIGDLTRMKAEVEIDENDIIHVEPGDSATIMVDAFPDKTFKGVVTEINNEGITTGSGTMEEMTNFLASVSLPEQSDHVRPGMSATVDIVTDSAENVTKVPIECVTTRMPVEIPEIGRSSPVKVVFLIQDGKVQQIEVETGISSDTEWEIKQGLEKGQEIVNGPYRTLSKILKHGDRVVVDNSMKSDPYE